ncbi:MAG TPA: hypothetical protein VJ654_03085, partial [Noviherbaspirillum sp.]|nr:hypothetical protein [Noviherbaspirillum sp.]
MMLAHKLAAPMDTPLYVDDVFSTYLYTGNGSTQTITNGIDLAGKGGVVWLKTRSQVGPNQLIDTVRGLGKYLITDTTAAQASASLTYLITAFNSSGFSLGLNNSGENASGVVNASYTFRKAAKFFDVVTWTGDGAGSKLVNHALGGTIGWSLIKRTDSSGDWAVYALNASGNHAYWISAGAGLSTSSAATNSNASFLSSYFTSTTIDVGSISGSGTMALNMSGATYVAYLFAHDPDTTNGIIQCGSYTGNGSTTGPTINLGWEPQFLLIKNAGGIGSWQMVDTMR